MTAPASEGAATTPTSIFALSPPPSPNQFPANRRQAYQASATAFVVLFCIVGVSLWGLPFYCDFMVQQFSWTRAQVTSGNALSKLIVGPIFGIGLGGDYMINTLMTAEIFGIDILGRLLGLILTAGGIAEAAAPWF